jgi:predicted ATPase
MIEHVTGGRVLPPEVLSQIVDRADGVPLFVEELTRAVLELGLLKEEAGHLALDGPLPPFAIPSTLQDSLMARLDRYAPVREVAQIGAVIGREFSRELLAEVADFSATALNAAMEQLITTGLVSRRGSPTDPRYLFKHALVQDAAYGSLLISRRQQLHARIGRVLEQRSSQAVETEPELLAYHFGQAGLAEKAVEYHEQAGRRALARWGIEEALAQFGGALARLNELPRSEERLRRELDLRLALGSGHVAAQGFAAPATGEAYRRAAELCDELGDGQGLFPVLYGLCLYHLYAAELREARAVAGRLLRLAEAEQDRGLSFFAHRAAGVTALPAGHFVAARSHLELALDLYDPVEHRSPTFVYAFDPKVVCLDYLARALLPLGHARQALTANAQAIEEARRLSHQNSLALALFFGGVLHQILGDRPGVTALTEELAQIATETGFRFWSAGAAILRGWAVAEAGDPGSGDSMLARGIEEWRGTGAEYMVPYFLALYAQVKLRGNQVATALELLGEAKIRIERTEERWFAAEILRLEGEANMMLGPDSHVRAEACLKRSLSVAREQEARLWELRAASSLSRIQGDRDI